MGKLEFAPGLFAVDHDGAHCKQLASCGGAAFVRDPLALPLLPSVLRCLHDAFINRNGRASNAMKRS